MHDYEMEELNSAQRTGEDIKDLLKHAKINEVDLKQQTQCIYFDNSGNLADQFRLLEVDTNLIQHLESGGRLTVKASNDDYAVVCTDSKTYSVKEAEITNSMLILPNLQMPGVESNYSEIIHQKVLSVRRTYWELREESIVKLFKLNELLSENPYRGPEKENDEKCRGKKYTLEELLKEVPASESQIIFALNNMKVCLINGFYRLLDFDYITRLLTEITNFVEENSWSWKEIYFETTLRTLSELEPAEVLHKWFSIYGEKNDEQNNTWRLNETKICQLYAEILLHSVEKFHLRDFTRSWEESVPDGMTPDFKMLEGLAIVDRDSKPPFIQYFPTSRLPNEPMERFERLFRTKQKWTLEEITPYIQ